MGTEPALGHICPEAGPAESVEVTLKRGHNPFRFV